MPEMSPNRASQVPEISPADFLARPAAKRSNGWAVTSLVTGLIGCLGITALAAVITGIIGIKKANRPDYAGAGKGMALAGLILGVIWLLAAALVVPIGGLGIFAVVKGTEAPRQLAKGFVRDLANNDIEAAAAKVKDSSLLTPARLEAISDEMDSPPADTGPTDWGRFKDLNGTNVSINSSAGVDTFDYSGTAEFDHVVKRFSITEVKEGGTWKITAFELTD